MNRQQRRQSARQSRRHGIGQPHAGCGCTLRRLVPLDWTDADCPACGAPSPFFGADGVTMPTGDAPGTVTPLEVGCSCGATYVVQTLVDFD